MTGDGREDVWRSLAPHVLAVLARRCGDFDAAEDAVQEALLAAAVQWPADGVPDNPTGWLVRVASRRLVDHWRSDLARHRRELAAFALEPPATVPTSARDDSLAVLSMCCHPVLTPPARVALTLRAVAGLSTRQIATAFGVPETTMAQRISRAKATLRDAGVRFHPLTGDELADRMPSVCQVLYLLFNEGYTASVGPALYDETRTTEAIRLTRGLLAAAPADHEVAGLLALMLLTAARRPARSHDDGSLVPLAEQDRSRWDSAAIAEGVSLVERVLPRGHVGPYQLQAAIAAVHADARTWAETDWPQIAELYRMLDRLSPNASVTLNRAVAVAMADGPDAGLALLAPLLADPTSARAHRVHAVHAHLLEMSGRRAEAGAEYAVAARLTASIPEQRYLNEAIGRCTGVD